MLFHKVVTIILLAGYLTAACQAASNPKSPTSTITTIPYVPTSTTIKQVATGVPTEEEVSTAEPTQEPTHPDPAETEAGEISSKVTEEVLISVDGLELAGTFYTPRSHTPPWPGVILVHMLNGDQSQWESFPQQLAEAGLAVLSIDLRGHGETGGKVDWDLAATDLQLVWSYLIARQDIDQDRIAFIGASIGANLALIASANEPSVRTAVLLSPGLSYAGVETESAMISYGERPVLIIASQDDVYAANSSTALDAGAIGESQLIMYKDAGHGTFMFRAEPELSQLITEWLALHLE